MLAHLKRKKEKNTLAKRLGHPCHQVLHHRCVEKESNSFHTHKHHSHNKGRIFIQKKGLDPDRKKGEGYPADNIDKDDYFGIAAQGQSQKKRSNKMWSPKKQIKRLLDPAKSTSALSFRCKPILRSPKTSQAVGRKRWFGSKKKQNCILLDTLTHDFGSLGSGI